MFTGLVEVIGTVLKLEPLDTSVAGGNGTSLTIGKCGSILEDVKLGDSISCNGTCLTVTEFANSDLDQAWFKVGVSPETLRRTNLGSLEQDSGVNLERAVTASTKMGGHFVQGHVDTIATILSVTPDGNAFTYRLRPRESGVMRYVVEKGWVTLDGASLTITKVNDGDNWFEVMLIPYTQERVVMGSKADGKEVNLEVDMVGKYVEKSVEGYFQGQRDDAPAILEKLVSRLVEEKLQAMKH